VRSILLRGFDQQLAEMIGKHMTEHGVKFIRPCVPTKIEKISDGEPGLYKVLCNLCPGISK
jgi:thioredoxin reductase (NADPH)